MSERLAVRAPNHLGELLLALPALASLARAEEEAGRPPPVVQVVRPLVPILELAGLRAQLLPLERRHAVAAAARALRRTGAKRGILLTPSFSAALIFRAAGLASRRGTTGLGRALLLTERVDRRPLLRRHRVWEYLTLAGCDPAAGDPPPPTLRDRQTPAAAWEELARAPGSELPPVSGDSASDGREGATWVALFPGGNAPSRRWPAERFRELAGRMVRRGKGVLVFGGASERELTAAVAAGGAGGDGRCVDLGGRTTLTSLAGGFLASDVLVTNDTGPMHLAAALDRPIVALEGAADIHQTRPLARCVRLVGRLELPCVPCVRNRCPRRGPGYRLADARLECMRLISVDEVEAAVLSVLNEGV